MKFFNKQTKVIRTVDTILSDFSKAVDELNAVTAAKNAEVARHNDAIETLKAKAEAASEEASRAAAVAGRIFALIK